MKTRFFLAAAAVVATSANAFAADIWTDEENGRSLGIGVLIQPWFQVTAPYKAGKGTAGVGAPSGPEGNGVVKGHAKNPSLDLFLRHARITVYGSIDKSLRFYLSIDQPDAFKDGTLSAPFDGVPADDDSIHVFDAFATYQFVPEFMVDLGMFPVPLSHHNLEGAAWLNTMDFHEDVFRFPAGRATRDAGVEFRGLVADRLHYRVGVFEGVRNLAALQAPVEPVGTVYADDLNENGIPRFTGHVRFNILGSEPDFFFHGIYFSKTPLVSIGVGGDYQPNAIYNLQDKPAPYGAGSVDAFAEIPFTPDFEIIAKGNFFYWTEGWSRILQSNTMEQGGISAFGELGVRYRWIEPLVFVDYVKGNSTDVVPRQSRDSEILAPHVGLNFWAKQHTLNFKIDAGYRKAKKDVRPSITNDNWRTELYGDYLFTMGAQAAF